MQRFGDDSALSFLVGLEVRQVCLGEFQTQFAFSDDTSLRLEGKYAHRIPTERRELVQARSGCGPNELQRLLGKSVTAARVLSPEQAELVFSNGDSLLLVDDSDQYESFIFTLRERKMVV